MSKVLLYVSTGLFVLSLLFQCYYLEGDEPVWGIFKGDPLGLTLLLIGWIGLFQGEFAWIANPLWIVAMISIAYSEKSFGSKPYAKGGAWLALVLSFAALILALTFVFQKNTYCGKGPAGRLSQIGGFSPGFILWISSMSTQVLEMTIAIYETSKDDPV